MAWNEYLHAWGTFAISPFANAIILCKEAPTPATAIDAPATVDAVIGQDTTVTVTVTPEGASDILIFESENPQVFTVTKTGANTAIVTGQSAGTANLNVTTESGLTDTSEVTVTAE